MIIGGLTDEGYKKWISLEERKNDVSVHLLPMEHTPQSGSMKVAVSEIFSEMC